MKILTKAITADAQVVAGECYVVGAELNDLIGNAFLELFDEDASTQTAAQLFVILRASAACQSVNIMFPMPGLKCNGVYADIDGTDAAGTLYYYY
jgi:hypothetical protein